MDDSLTMLEGMAKFMDDGGIFMWILLAQWIVGMVISIERFIGIVRIDVDGKNLMGQIQRKLLGNDIQGAVSLCSRTSAVLAQVLRSGLKRIHQSTDLIQHSMETTIFEVSGSVDKRLNYISLIANISTLVGLLGTIYGLIESFSAVATADPSQKSKLLALGISKAMNTTALGLISAISIMVIHTVLTNKCEKILSNVDEFSLKLVDLLGTKRNKPPVLVEVPNEKAA